jgi:chemotaxis protein methyltransferase CheR
VTAESAPLPEESLARLVALVREETGNVMPRARHGFLEEIAARRARALGYEGGDAYVRALAAGGLPGEWRQLIPLVTVKESFFFRAPQQFAAIERHLLPELVRRKGWDRALRIWSAAAARGEEPATLALILAEHPALAAWNWSILATDLDADALSAAGRGLYGARAVSQVPPRLLERWFTRRGALYELDPRIRSRIDYRPLNLARTPYADLPAEPFDLILLRNVLIYFRRPLQRRVVAEVTGRLAAGGYVFLGASETLWQIFDRLAPVELDECFAYRHPERPEEPAPPARRPPPTRPAPEPAQAPGCRIEPNDAATARRVAPLPIEAEPVVADEVPEARPEPPRPRAGAGAQEQLLEAAREVAANRLDGAAERVAKAREADPSEPAAYAFEGFLHDLGGRSEEAAAAYRAALYLEPGLFQVRVLLADCLRRLGRRDRAEHEFRQVLATLERGTPRDLLPLLEEVPFPNRERAARRCRQALAGR